MNGGVSWFLMTAMGFAAMFAMRYTPDWLDWILVRFAGFSFAGAGVIGASGWIGSMFDFLFGWLINVLNSISSWAVGTTIAWIAAAALAALWIGGMLPDRLFSYDPPDWLVISGLVVPALVAMVPGRAGNAMELLITRGGHALSGAVGGWF